MTAPNGRSGSDRDPRARRAGTAYQGAFESVFAILIGAGLGYWADSSFDTAPRYLLIGFFLGFGAFVLRLVRLGRQLNALSEQTQESGEE